ncbi:MAG: hypothetical protein WBR26_23680 [Candidatus Acidiferrum sp.]
MATPEQRPIVDLPRLTLASRKHAEALRRVILNQVNMSSALELPKLSEAFQQHISSELFASGSALPEFLRDMASPQPTDSSPDLDKIAEALIQQASATGENVIASAVVLLSHATADDVFTSVCESAIDLDPAKWITELNMERKIPLSLLREKGAAGVFALELDKLCHQVAAKPLPSRAELFFRYVKIRHHPKFSPADPEYFRISKLVDADELKNSIAHGSTVPQIDLDLSKRTMSFLHEAAMTALRSLAAAYRLPFDWNTLLGAQPENPA